jgi:cardiolipin synthase A/B
MEPPEPNQPDHAEPHIPFPASGSYPARSGNAVHPLIDGVPAFRRIGEAIEAARHSVWVTVTFYAPDFEMPCGRGSLFDVLDRAGERGLDVRAIFWRPNPESGGYGRTFPGSDADREMLRARGSRFRIRWDRAPGPHCHHQKCWLIDAGHPSETTFVGGMNLTAQAVGAPGHAGGGRHDAYVELTGPSGTDVHHNFVQRWNETSERDRDDGVWGHTGDDDLTFPTRLSHPRGESLVQIQRTMPAGRYRGMEDGERTILDQYLFAIDAARRSIYIENQALPIPPVAFRLEEALKRGVDVVALVPADPDEFVRAARRNPDRKAFIDQVVALGRYETFALVGIAARTALGDRRNVYVHGKLILIDDAWATIGSCNLHTYSLFGHSEMNVSFWDPTVVRALRRELLAEHLGRDTADLDDRAALGLYRQIARANRARRNARDNDWQGLAFSLDPATYGE